MGFKHFEHSFEHTLCKPKKLFFQSDFFLCNKNQ